MRYYHSTVVFFPPTVDGLLGCFQIHCCVFVCKQACLFMLYDADNSLGHIPRSEIVR